MAGSVPGSYGWLARDGGVLNMTRPPRDRALGAALVLLAPTIAAATAPVPAVLTPQDTLQLQRIAAYLNGIRTMTARFRQVANNGGVSAGKLWVARPGRRRFEYDPPTPRSSARCSAGAAGPDDCRGDRPGAGGADPAGHAPVAADRRLSQWHPYNDRAVPPSR